MPECLNEPMEFWKGVDVYSIYDGLVGANVYRVQFNQLDHLGRPRRLMVDWRSSLISTGLCCLDRWQQCRYELAFTWICEWRLGRCKTW